MRVSLKDTRCCCFFSFFLFFRLSKTFESSLRYPTALFAQELTHRTLTSSGPEELELMQMLMLLPFYALTLPLAYAACEGDCVTEDTVMFFSSLVPFPKSLLRQLYNLVIELAAGQTWSRLVGP